MSHMTYWTCRSCRTVLGTVRDRALYPVVLVEAVDGRGLARLRCPKCARVRVWWPLELKPSTSFLTDASGVRDSRPCVRRPTPPGRLGEGRPI